jgi:hypothetical protein
VSPSSAPPTWRASRSAVTHTLVLAFVRLANRLPAQEPLELMDGILTSAGVQLNIPPAAIRARRSKVSGGCGQVWSRDSRTAGAPPVIAALSGVIWGEATKATIWMTTYHRIRESTAAQVWLPEPELVIVEAEPYRPFGTLQLGPDGLLPVYLVCGEGQGAMNNLEQLPLGDSKQTVTCSVCQSRT